MRCRLMLPDSEAAIDQKVVALTKEAAWRTKKMAGPTILSTVAMRAMGVSEQKS